MDKDTLHRDLSAKLEGTDIKAIRHHE